MSRLVNKAWALNEAWKAKYNGQNATIEQLAKGLSVSEHESSSGDAWPGWHNWGATQLPSEFQTLPDGHPVFHHPSLPSPGPIHALAEQIGSVRLIESGKLPMEYNGAITFPAYAPAWRALYVDSTDGSNAKAYWVFEAAFPTDRQGAHYFLDLLMRLGGTPEGLQLWTPAELAAQMKDHGYYGGSEAAYATSLQKLYPGIEAALAGLDPTDLPVTPGYDSPEPMPPSWGKAPAPPQGGAPSPPSSSSEPDSLSSSSALATDPPMEIRVWDPREAVWRTRSTKA